MATTLGKRMVDGVCWEEPVHMKKRARTDDTSPVSKAESESEDETEEVDSTFVWKLAGVLQDMINSAKGQGKVREELPENSKLGIFYSAFKQNFTLEFYIRRLVDYAKCSKAAFVLMLIFLDRVLATESEITLSDHNVHRLCMTALILGTKYLEDVVHTNSYYAKVGGISSLKEMNQLEASMLSTLNYKLFVDPEVFKSYDKLLWEY